jgi:thioredoxin-like negative regulator of GroEL
MVQGREVDRIVGALPKEAIRARLEQALGNAR